MTLCVACPAPRPYGNLVASHGASTVLNRLERAIRTRSGEGLLQTFTTHCLRHCEGFRFRLTARRGPLHRFRWEKRRSAGSLPDDLYGSLSSWRRIDQARVGFASFTLQSTRLATATLTLAVDGTLRDGSRRSDRGTLRVVLRRSADQTWQIHGLDPAAMETLVCTKALFEPAPHQPRVDPLPGPRRGTDLGALLADRGPGLAVADVNGDGRLDLFLPGPGLGRLLLGSQGSLQPGPPLPASMARGEAGLFGDFDQDGDPDLLVLASHGSSTLLENQGQGRFRPSSRLRLGPGSAAAWLDVDGDGRLDLLFAPRLAQGRARPWLLRNQGRRFVRWKTALPAVAQPTVAACAGDLNGDGRTDLVLVSGLGPVSVLLNRRGRLKPSGPAGPTLLGRACSIADLDGDGDLDVVIAAVHSREAWKYAQPGFPLPGAPFRTPRGLRSRLARAVQGTFWLRNSGRGRFSRQTLASPASLGWDTAVTLADLDADGRPDVLLAGGHHHQKNAPAADDLYFTRALPRQLLARSWNRITPAHSLGATRAAAFLWNTPAGFMNAGAPAGLKIRGAVRAAVWADLDRSGTPELIVRQRDGGLRIWRTRGLQPGRSLTLHLATRGAVAQGATVTVWALERRMTAHLGGSGPAGEVRVGLGNAVRADKVEIRWPDGHRQTIQDLRTNASYTVFKGRSEPRQGLAWAGAPPPPRTPSRPLPPPARPGTLAGIVLGGLNNLVVTTARGRRGLLQEHFGKGATVIFVPPATCPACPAFEQKLARLGRQLRGRGAKLLVLRPFRPGKKTTGLIYLGYSAKVPIITATTLERLLLLDGRGKVTLAYLGKLPLPLVLKQHIVRLIQK